VIPSSIVFGRPLIDAAGGCGQPQARNYTPNTAR
jgi:hypothetical protein